MNLALLIVAAAEMGAVRGQNRQDQPPLESANLSDTGRYPPPFCLETWPTSSLKKPSTP
ncbi:hypothetical protein QTJ16_003467 [Diplocarpon rosae]|uniref:Uncharacterized protein n=1 Tax=Diplocarpon rosae TaxID=946125 RepID=A0AAD9T178_9HELO|nr:hypothetical protein QTJ16_003467 [Diplocarpon rosae]